MKILVVVSHCDDEVLLCGATLAKLSSENRIEVLFLGASKTSRNEYDGLSEVKKSAFEVASILGIKDLHFYNIRDQMFDSESLLRIIKIIEEEIRQLKPEMIFTHHYKDLNLDHSITFRAVMTACRPPLCPVKKIYSGEVLSTTEWSLEEAFKPNTYVDVEDTLSKKIEAMQVYEGELQEYPHPRSLEGIRILAKKRGMESGLKVAEAFQLIRSIE